MSECPTATSKNWGERGTAKKFRAGRLYQFISDFSAARSPGPGIISPWSIRGTCLPTGWGPGHYPAQHQLVPPPHNAAWSQSRPRCVPVVPNFHQGRQEEDLSPNRSGGNILVTACSGEDVCPRWHTCKKDGLNHLHWVTKTRLPGANNCSYWEGYSSDLWVLFIRISLSGKD